MTKEEIEEYGPIAAQYLKKYLSRDSNVDTSKSGIYSDKGSFKIGSKPIKIEDDDIIINDMRFKGTPGLWRLLTSKNIPDKFNAIDLRDYIYIMSDTNVTHVKYDKDNRRISGNDKMNKLIKPLVITFEKGGEDALTNKISGYFGFEKETDEAYEEYEEENNQPSTISTGLKILPSDPNALIERFDLLFSSKKAGHTGVRNEIVSILDELKRQGVIKTNEYKKLNSLIKK